MNHESDILLHFVNMVLSFAIHFQYDFEGTNKAGIIPDHVINYDVHSYRTTDLEMLKVLELIRQKK